MRRLDKIETIFKKMNNIASNRFSFVVTTKDDVNAAEITSRVTAYLKNSNLQIFNNSNITSQNFGEISNLSEADDLESNVLNNILHSNECISIFIKGKKTAFIFDHSIADGRSAVTFVLSLLSKDFIVEEVNTDYQSVYNNMPIRYQGISGIFLTLRAIMLHAIAPFIEGFTEFSKGFDRKGSYDTLFVQKMILDQNSTKKLLALSKANRVSVNSFLVAVQMLATAEEVYEKENQVVAVTAAVDIREECSQATGVSLLGLFVSFITVVIKVDNNDSILDVALKVHRKFKTKLRLGEHMTLFKFFPPLKFLSTGIVRFMQNLNEVGSLSTNGGVIEDFVPCGVDHVDKLEAYVPPGEKQPFSLLIFTLKGEVNITMLSYSDRFHNDDAKSVFENIKLKLNSLS